MAGHNKWSKIKHKKATTDAKRSKEFSKMSLILTLESKKCNGDVSSPSLKTAIERAKAVNMPNTNIEKAIKKGSSDESKNLEKIVYETYGPGGCVILITTLTDNKNRTASQIRHILSKQGCSLAAPGSTNYLFDNEGNPKMMIDLKEEDVESLKKLLNILEEQDDVELVISNANL